MTKAYVLLNSEMGFEKSIQDELIGISSVRSVFKTFGAYDLILQIEEQDSDFLKEVVFHRIRKIVGVKQTMTLMIT